MSDVALYFMPDEALYFMPYVALYFILCMERGTTTTAQMIYIIYVDMPKFKLNQPESKSIGFKSPFCCCCSCYGCHTHHRVRDPLLNGASRPGRQRTHRRWKITASICLFSSGHPNTKSCQC
jgi:hypothetical protein